MVVIGKTDQNSTPGEKKIFNHLLKLDEVYPNYYFCYQPRIIDRYPDFLIIGKEIGVVIIEIKDYTDELSEVRGSGDWVSSKNGDSLRNPFDQVKHYIDEISISTANLKVPKDIKKFVQCIVALPEITTTSEIWDKIDRKTPSNYIMLYKNEIHSTHTKFYDEFKSRIKFDFSLNNEQLKNLKAKLVPISVVPSTRPMRLGEFIYEKTDFYLLDKKQEQFSRELGEGHRIVYGVAGSGKTVMLIARAKYLATKYPDWNILILCYNRLLRDFIEKTLVSNNYMNIHVFNYHSFAYKKINSNDKFKDEYIKLMQQHKDDQSKFYQEIVPYLLVNSINDQDRKYDAVLVDEGQDFAKSWFNSVMKLLNPITKSLLITLDGLQSIFERKKFTWSSVGIEARGRTVYLEESYRNPKTIGEFARSFLLMDEEIKEGIISDEELVPTKEFLRTGGDVKYIDSRNIWDNRKKILALIKQYLNENLTILLLYRYDYSREEYKGKKDKLLVLLAERKILFNYMKKTWKLDRPGINVNTINGVKGLEADVVIIPDINEYQPTIVNRKLCYMAMTRAIKNLVISSTGESKWVSEIRSILKN